MMHKEFVIMGILVLALGEHRTNTKASLKEFTK